MLRFTSVTRWFVALMIVSWQSAALAADLPTADEILRIHRANKERLAQLHLRLVQRYETTEASCRHAQKQAALKEQFLKGVDRQNPDNTVITGADGKRIDPALIRLIIPELEREVATLRGQSKPFQVIRPMEFFQNGDDYQFRTPLDNVTTAAELAAWRISRPSSHGRDAANQLPQHFHLFAIRESQARGVLVAPSRRPRGLCYAQAPDRRESGSLTTLHGRDAPALGHAAPDRRLFLPIGG